MSMHWVYERFQRVLDLVSNVLNPLARAEIGDKVCGFLKKNFVLT